VVSVGAILLAVLFGQLTARVPNSDGGLYAYARHEFGDFAGYLTGWSYWISSWPGNAAIAVSWVFYVNALFGAQGKQAFALIEEVGERVAAVMVVSYPPGIPLLMPGEQAGASDGPILGNLKALQDLDRKFPGFEHDIHGVRRGAGGAYEVMCVQRHAAGQDGAPAHA
jgi:hypothetical protein